MLRLDGILGCSFAEFENMGNSVNGLFNDQKAVNMILLYIFIALFLFLPGCIAKLLFSAPFKLALENMTTFCLQHLPDPSQLLISLK